MIQSASGQKMSEKFQRVIFLERKAKIDKWYKCGWAIEWKYAAIWRGQRVAFVVREFSLMQERVSLYAAPGHVSAELIRLH
jgi:hypothetical protein